MVSLAMTFSLMVSSCRTVSPLPPVDLAAPGWRVEHGQAVWRSSERTPEIAGELFFALHPDGRAMVQFIKTPLPLVVAQSTSNAWQIEFISEDKAFRGSGNPPSRIGWLQVSRCLSGMSPGKDWDWRRKDGGRWRLENRRSGEMIEGYLGGRQRDD